MLPGKYFFEYQNISSNNFYGHYKCKCTSQGNSVGIKMLFCSDVPIISAISRVAQCQHLKYKMFKYYTLCVCVCVCVCVCMCVCVCVHRCVYSFVYVYVTNLNLN